MDKVKVTPTKDQDFKEIEVSTKNWNLKTRRDIEKLLSSDDFQEKIKLQILKEFGEKKDKQN